MRLFLQLVDLIFFLSYHVVFLVNVMQLLLQLLLQFLDDRLLCLELSLLVGNLALELVDLRRCVGQPVLRGLKLSLRTHAHVVDLSQAGLILLLDGLNLLLSIVIDLAHCLCVVLLHGLDVVLQGKDLILLDFDLVRMVFHLLVRVRGVLVIDGGLSLMEFVCFLLLLFLEFLVAGGVFKHLLVVLVALAFKLLVLLLCKFLDGFLELLFHLLLCYVELLVFVSVLKLHA